MQMMAISAFFSLFFGEKERRKKKKKGYFGAFCFCLRANAQLFVVGALNVE